MLDVGFQPGQCRVVVRVRLIEQCDQDIYVEQSTHPP